MFTLTVILENTDHKIVLGYENLAHAQAARDIIDTVHQGGADPLVRITDDFGQIAEFKFAKVIFHTIIDLEGYGNFHKERALVRLRAENKLQVDMQTDPTLRFLIGNAGSIFPKDE